jgi:hypothetical protein
MKPIGSRFHVGPIRMHNRKFGPYLAAFNRILVSVMAPREPSAKPNRLRPAPAWPRSVFKEKNFVQWTMAPLETLYDVDRIVEAWGRMGMRVHRTPTLGQVCCGPPPCGGCMLKQGGWPRCFRQDTVLRAPRDDRQTDSVLRAPRNERTSDRQTDRQTNRLTDRQHFESAAEHRKGSHFLGRAGWGGGGKGAIDRCVCVPPSSRTPT